MKNLVLIIFTAFALGGCTTASVPFDRVYPLMYLIAADASATMLNPISTASAVMIIVFFFFNLITWTNISSCKTC